MRGRFGSVLVLTLWVLFFLSALAVAVGGRVASDVTAARRLEERSKARWLAWAAVDFVRAHAMAATNPMALASNPDVFRQNHTAGAAGYFSVTWLNRTNAQGVVTNYGVGREGLKLNLNRASQKELVSLMSEKGGLDPVRAQEVSRAILQCRRGTDGLTRGEPSEYLGDSPYRCRTARFELAEELLLVQEVRRMPGLFARMLPHVTVHSDSSFSGLAAGVVASGTTTQTVHFVLDPTGRILSWRED
jgi:type II secretory pathway component PulK